jgi:hypothetical protein
MTVEFANSIDPKTNNIEPKTPKNFFILPPTFLILNSQAAD